MTEPDPTPIRVAPERFIAGGEALGHDADGRIVFVRGGAPGDEVSVTVVEQTDRWSRALVVDVHEPSPMRVTPPCPQRRDGCGGCDWQHIDVAHQLPSKAEIVRDALRRTGRLDAPDLIIGQSVPAEGYRTSLRVVGDDDGRAAFRLDRSNETIAAMGCLVAHEGLHSLLDMIRLDPGLEVSLRVSAATGVATARWDRRRGAVDGLPARVHVGQRAHVIEHVAGHDLRVSAASFFQSGPAAAELLVDAVRRAAPELAGAKTVLDAYAGVGLFAVTVAPPEATVITVETSRAAVEDCQANLQGRDAWIERSEVSAWRGDPSMAVDVAIADPARSGLGRPGVASMVAVGADVLVLVSCDPVALARDAELLSRHGYRHDGTEVLDLFPHTHHVECVTRFVRS